MSFSTSNPVHIVLLTDQSVRSILLCNRVIFEAIIHGFRRDKPMNFCFISVIGYGNDVKVLCSGFPEDLYNNPIRVEQRKQKVADRAGGLVEITVHRPIWLEPLTVCIEDDKLHNCLLESVTLANKFIEEKKNMPSLVLDVACSFAKEDIDAKCLFPSSIVFGLTDIQSEIVCENKSYHSIHKDWIQYDHWDLGNLPENGIGTVHNFYSLIEMIRYDDIPLDCIASPKIKS